MIYPKCKSCVIRDQCAMAELRRRDELGLSLDFLSNEWQENERQRACLLTQLQHEDQYQEPIDAGECRAAEYGLKPDGGRPEDQ